MSEVTAKIEEKMYNLKKPSDIMRKRRPNLYSDSSIVGAYTLSRSEFSHFLDTLTDRNQHKEFEIFCRHLCERVLCPNLRTQTGPEGGGDGKVDTETYAVSDEVLRRWFVGDANAGKERWGFAISTKSAWLQKVKNDVTGIKQTGREYSRIFFLTNRPIKASKCHEVEKILTEKHGVTVTIFDREWIIEKTIQNRYEDIAHSDLGAGTFNPEKVSVGSNDHRRNQELEEIETRISRLGTEPRDLTQFVIDTFEAATLSRELERPRIETEGRFRRAIDAAVKSGRHNEILRARYEHVWTMYWWYDDIDPMNQSYEDIENIASKFENVTDLSKVDCLLRILETHARRGCEVAEQLQLAPRKQRLTSMFSRLSEDKSRPNNALYAETLLVLARIVDTAVKSDEGDFEEIWHTLANILERAEGLGEFPADLIDNIVELISGFVPDSKALDNLTEKLAEFMGKRKKEGKAGKIYYYRGKQKLENELPEAAVTWLGKASICFMKEEYRDELYETLYCLTVAYRSVGLPWAARAVCLASLVQVNEISAKSAQTRFDTISAVSLFALLSLQLGRISDFLVSIYWMEELLVSLPIDGHKKESIEKQILEFDHLFWLNSRFVCKHACH